MSTAFTIEIHMNKIYIYTFNNGNKRLKNAPHWLLVTEERKVLPFVSVSHHSHLALCMGAF